MDIVDRIRKKADDDEARLGFWNPVITQAADEIDDLRAQLERVTAENAELRRERDAAEKAAHDNADMYRRHVETLRKWNESQPDCKVAPAYIEACARAEAAEARLTRLDDLLLALSEAESDMQRDYILAEYRGPRWHPQRGVGDDG